MAVRKGGWAGPAGVFISAIASYSTSGEFTRTIAAQVLCASPNVDEVLIAESLTSQINRYCGYKDLGTLPD